MIDLYEELGETSRRQILAELRCGPKTVTDLVRATCLKQPNVSNHLARMKARGIVDSSAAGRERLYRIASPEMEALVCAVFSIKRCPEGTRALCPLVERYTEAAMHGDEQVALEIIDEAYRSRASLLDIYEELLTPAMQHVGELYLAGSIDEAHEHLASEVTLRMISRTIQFAGPARRTDKVCVLGLAAGCWHSIGLRMAADYLRLIGWKTLYLGSNVPASSFLSAVREYRPSLTLLSCVGSYATEATIQLVQELRILAGPTRSFRIGVGGTGVRLQGAQLRRAGADFGASSLRAFAVGILPAIDDGADLSDELAWNACCQSRMAQEPPCG
jgi:methanogenic corrinoid protein MtbC1